MKALSIKQPWATAIMHHGKDIENRNWSTKFRGRVAVHASKSVTLAEIDDFRTFTERFTAPINLKPPMDKGAIIGTVEIFDCVQQSDSPWFVGDHGLVLRNPQPLKTPIPISGKLGFWDVPNDVVLQIYNQQPPTPLSFDICGKCLGEFAHCICADPTCRKCEVAVTDCTCPESYYVHKWEF